MIFFFYYGPETKHHSMHWTNPKFKENKSTNEQVQINSNEDNFFRIAHIYWEPECQIIKQIQKKVVLTTLHERMRRKKKRERRKNS